MVKGSRPDFVVVDSSDKTVYLFELTVCFERADNIESAYQRKYNRYSPLAADIEESGHQ